jgi:hypothetical protein
VGGVTKRLELNCLTLFWRNKGLRWLKKSIVSERNGHRMLGRNKGYVCRSMALERKGHLDVWEKREQCWSLITYVTQKDFYFWELAAVYSFEFGFLQILFADKRPLNFRGLLSALKGDHESRVKPN